MSIPCKHGCSCGRHSKKRGYYHHTQEARDRIGRASRERPRRPLTVEQRELIAAATRTAMARPEVRLRTAAGLRRALATPEYRELRGRISARLVAEGRIGSFKGPSRPQLALRDMLERIGYRTKLEVPFDRAAVDIYLVDLHIAVEADGVFWHGVVEKARPGYYRRRDYFLRARFGLPTVRFTDVEIKHLTDARLREVIANVEAKRSR